MPTDAITASDRVQELERLETEINSEAASMFRSIGEKLMHIRNKGLYVAAGFQSWQAYCKSGRVNFTKRYADTLIRSAELRPKLGTICSHEWTESHMKELCKCETDNDAKRVAKKAMAIAEKQGERLTARIIAQVRDSKEETGAADARAKKRLESSSLSEHVKKLTHTLCDYQYSLDQLPIENWSDLPKKDLSFAKQETQRLLKLWEKIDGETVKQTETTSTEADAELAGKLEPIVQSLVFAITNSHRGEYDKKSLICEVLSLEAIVYKALGRKRKRISSVPKGLRIQLVVEEVEGGKMSIDLDRLDSTLNDLFRKQ